VIVLVALMGAGWFTYRSFAATQTALITAAQLDRSAVTEDKASTGKNGNRVARLAPGESIKWTVSPNVLNNSSRYQFCLTTRYENPSTSSKPAQLTMFVRQLVGWNNSTGTGTKFADTRYALLANSYQQVCTRTFTGWGRDAAEITVANNGPSTARIYLMLVNKQ
jgi:hypothetical protein